MKKLSTLFSFVIILIAACQPSETVIQTAIAQTQAAIPTATLIPFSALDLESILITSGDLPAGYEAAQIRSELSGFSKAAPTPDYYISQSFSYKGRMGGLIEILVYDDISNLQAAYKLTLNNLPGELNNVEIGEGGEASALFFPVEAASLSFFHCHAVVVIQFMETSVYADAVSYGKRLDERITPIVCR